MAGFKQKIIEEGAGVGKLYEGEVFVDDVRYRYWLTLSIDPSLFTRIRKGKSQKRLCGFFFLKHKWRYLNDQTFRLVISDSKRFKINVTLEGPLGKWHFFKRAER